MKDKWVTLTSGGKCFFGFIREVDGDKALVKCDDGLVRWVALDALRFLKRVEAA